MPCALSTDDIARISTTSLCRGVPLACRAALALPRHTAHLPCTPLAREKEEKSDAVEARCRVLLTRRVGLGLSPFAYCLWDRSGAVKKLPRTFACAASADAHSPAHGHNHNHQRHGSAPGSRTRWRVTNSRVELGPPLAQFSGGLDPSTPVSLREAWSFEVQVGGLLLALRPPHVTYTSAIGILKAV